jgi:uncharacterized protein involved in exopolysaccharide biosynthesis
MEDHASQGSFRDAVLAVVRRRRVVVAVYGGAVVSAVAGLFLLPPQYQAAAKILVNTTRADISTSADRPTELVRTGQVSLGELSSQIEILRSRDLIEEVLAGWDEPPPAPEGGNGVPAILASVVAAPGTFIRTAYRRFHQLDDREPSSPAYRRISRILGDLGVGALKNSNVIEVSYKGLDPVWAREFVNRLTAAYVERHARLQRVSQAEDFFNTQADLLRQKLAASEESFRRLKEQAGTLAGQQAQILQRLNELEGDLTQTRIARAEQERRVAFLEGAKAEAGPRGRVATPELLGLEAKRAELLGHYAPDSERLRDVEEQIARLRAAIASYDSIAVGSDAGGGDLVEARATLAALKGKEEALAQVRDQHAEQAKMVDSQNFDLVRLERQVKIDEETYLSYVRTAEESRLSNALEQSKLLRLTVIESATLPMDPVAPNRGRVLGFALLGGLALAVGAAFAVDRLDTTLKRAADVTRYCNLEVLTVLPDRVW